jgi:iron complex transport system permease protein
MTDFSFNGVRNYRRGMLFLLIALTLIFPLFAVRYGAVGMSISEVIDALLPFLLSDPDADQEFLRLVLWEVRLPRVLMAMAVGAALALAGVMLQTLFRNPLADPGLIGTASGAALAGAVAMILVAAWAPWLAELLGIWLVPVFAFFGALGALLIVLRLAQFAGFMDPGHLLLAGIAINALSGAGIGLLVYIATDDQLRNFTVWTLGTLAGASWLNLALMMLVSVVTLIASIWLVKPLNAFLLSEGDAKCLGFNVGRVKLIVLLLAALCVGVSVAFCGIIGFIGLVVPNLMRLIVGPDHRWLLPCSALAGAALLSVADLFARLVIAPSELPIGILTALVGAPFFIILLRLRVRDSAHG